MMRIYQQPASGRYFYAWRKVMFIVWIKINDTEVAFKTQTAANRNSAAIQARRAYPNGSVVSVLAA